MNFNASVPCEDGEMGAYMAIPESGKGPGIILLQEIFGVNRAMRTAADALAREGYAVLVPDLFWRIEPGINLGYTEEDRQQAFGAWQKFDQATGVQDCVSAAKILKEHEACNGNIAYLGFCLGGKLAVLAASADGAKAVVSFYGVRLQENHEELKNLPCPMQLHVGDQDAHVPMDVIEGLQEVLEGKTDADIFVYEGAQHGFFNNTRDDVFHVPAAGTARKRVLTFLAENLK